jgi:hypothetical protein
MNLRAKIYPHQLDAILNGTKDVEYRELETIELTDGTRSYVFKIKAVKVCGKTLREQVYTTFKDVPWTKHAPLVQIHLGAGVPL